jgi:hypothetical protein
MKKHFLEKWNDPFESQKHKRGRILKISQKTKRPLFFGFLFFKIYNFQNIFPFIVFKIWALKF